MSTAVLQWLWQRVVLPGLVVPVLKASLAPLKKVLGPKKSSGQ